MESFGMVKPMNNKNKSPYCSLKDMYHSVSKLTSIQIIANRSKYVLYETLRVKKGVDGEVSKRYREIAKEAHDIMEIINKFWELPKTQKVNLYRTIHHIMKGGPY